MSPRVLFAGGGTGGHLTPALALAEELRRRDSATEILLVGTDRPLDRRLLPESGFPHRFLQAPFLQRVHPWRNAALPVRFGRALAEARRIVAGFDPEVAVGTGGYVSAPVLVAARLAGVPVALQEQNAAPGVTNRFLGRIADEVYLNFPESRAFFPARARVVVTGNPISIGGPPPGRAELAARWGMDPARRTLIVTGGSQGARRINEVAVDLLRTAGPAFPYNLFFQTGREHHARVLEQLGGVAPPGVVVEPFFTPMKDVYPLVDLAVCRAGAMTLSEIACWGIPAILIPYPFATGGHQERNARAMVADQAAVWIPEHELAAGSLGEKIELLMENAPIRENIAERARRRGRREATREIADHILRLAASRGRPVVEREVGSRARAAAGGETRAGVESRTQGKSRTQAGSRARGESHGPAAADRARAEERQVAGPCVPRLAAVEEGAR